MKLLLTLGLAVLTVLLCDKYEDRLPPPIKWIYAGWKAFSHVLGTIMSFVILTVLWIIGFGTYGIIMKIITFPNRFASEPNSYWVKAKPTTVDSMKHQF